MLYLIARPMPMPVGRFEVSLISPDLLRQLILHAHDSKSLDSRVHFASTVQILSSLTGIRFEPGNDQLAPDLENGDCLIDIRLKPDTPKGRRITIDDLDFYRIEYSTADESRPMMFR